jgi:hypothetical protein
MGDEAMLKNDYDDARLYYSEGLADCNMYSIEKLTEIWKANISLRPSLHNLMGRCLGCLSSRAAAQGDTTAMSLLILYHTEGIGTQVSNEMSAHWESELNSIRKADSPVTVPVIEKRTKAKFSYLAGYAGSIYTPFGIMAGMTGDRFGVYGRFKTNASFQNYEGEMNLEYDPSGRELPPQPAADEYLIRTSQSRQTLLATAGLIIRYSSLLSFSLGTGYLQNERIFRYSQLDDTGEVINDNRSFKVNNYSGKGIVAEADGILTINRLFLSAGAVYYVSSKKYMDLNIGIGIIF